MICTTSLQMLFVIATTRCVLKEVQLLHRLLHRLLPKLPSLASPSRSPSLLRFLWLRLFQCLRSRLRLFQWQCLSRLRLFQWQLP